MSTRWIALIGAAVLGLAGCADNAKADGASPTPTPAASSPAGTWNAAGTGIDAGTRIVFGSTLELTEPCGASSGIWLGSADGALVPNITSLPSGCVRDTLTPAWLAQVVAYESAGDNLDLKAQDGTTAATLTRAIPAAEDPAVGEADANLIEAPAGAAATPPVSAAQLVGTWTPDVGAPIEFRDDGSWTSTYCGDPVGGRWALTTGQPSLLLAPDTLASLALCEQTYVNRLLGGVTLTAQSDGKLVSAGPGGQVILTHQS